MSERVCCSFLLALTLVPYVFQPSDARLKHSILGNPLRERVFVCKPENSKASFQQLSTILSCIFFFLRPKYPPSLPPTLSHAPFWNFSLVYRRSADPRGKFDSLFF